MKEVYTRRNFFLQFVISPRTKKAKNNNKINRAGMPLLEHTRKRKTIYIKHSFLERATLSTIVRIATICSYTTVNSRRNIMFANPLRQGFFYNLFKLETTSEPNKKSDDDAAQQHSIPSFLVLHCTDVTSFYCINKHYRV